MKILKDNFVKDATITGQELAQYPLVNVYSKYMEQIWKPGIGNGLLATIDLGEEKIIDTVVFSYTNADYQESDTITITPLSTDTTTIIPGLANTITISGEIAITWTLKNSSSVAVASGTVCIEDEICYSVLSEPVEAEYIEISAKGQTTDLYIGGVGAGESFDKGLQASSAVASLEPISNAGRTNEGFVTGRDDFALRNWEITTPDITPAEKLTFEDLIRTYGSASPFYAAEMDRNEPPIHGTFSRIGNFRRDSQANQYSMGITILEAR